MNGGTNVAGLLAVVVEANTAAANTGLRTTQANFRGTAAAAQSSVPASARAGAALKKVGTIAKYGAAAGLAAFVVMAKKSLDTTSELTKSTLTLTKNLGLNAKRASEWAGVARARGADATKLGMAFKTLSTNIKSASDGSDTSVKMFKDLGFTQADIQKSMGNTQFAVEKVAAGFGDLPAGIAKTTYAGKLFGRGWQTIFPVLRDGTDAMNAQLDTVEKYGGVLQGKTLKQQEDFLAAQRESKIAWQGMQVQLATALTPALMDVNEQFQKIAAINANPKLTSDEKFQRIADIIQKDFSTALDFIVDLIPTIASRVGQQAPKVALGFINGFLHADVWGKLLLGTWFFSKIGGATAVKTVGAKIAGMMFGTSAAGGIAGGIAGGTGGGVEIRGMTPATPLYVLDVAGGGPGRGVPPVTTVPGKGQYPKPIGPANVSGKSGMWFSNLAREHPIAAAGGIATLASGLASAGAPGVENTPLNKLNAMARGMDPTSVLHLVGMPSVTDLLPAVKKHDTGDVVAIMRNALGIPDIRHPLDLPKHTELHAAGQSTVTEPAGPAGPVGGPAPPMDPDLFAAAVDTLHGLVKESDVSGDKISDITAAMRGDYGSVAHAASKMSKEQVHSFLSIAVQAKTPQAELRDLTETFARAGKLSGKDIKGLAQATGLSMRDIRTWAKKGADGFGKAGDDMRSSSDKTKKAVGKDFDNMRDTARDKTASLAGSVSSIIAGLVNAVSGKGGFQTLQKNVNSALSAFGVGKNVDFSIEKVAKTAGKIAGTLFGQTGGTIPGAGVGDKVPLMAEPGEYLVNSVAAGKHKALLNYINYKDAPRMQKGGVIQQALGPYTIPPIMYDPNHAGGNSHVHADFFTAAQAQAYGHKMQGMGWTIGEYTPTQGNPFNFGPITTSHQSPGHYDGTAFDANTPQDETQAQVAAVAKLLGGGNVATGMQKLKRMMLQGPKGPFRDMGQGALDKAWHAANAFLAKQAPVADVTGGNVNVGAGVLSRGAMRKLMKAHGMADIMGYVSYAESGWDPNAGNGSYEGLWAEGAPFWSAHGGNKFGPWATTVHDPNAAASVAAAGYNVEGLTPWEASRNAGAGGGWGSHLGQPFKYGGLVQTLKSYGGGGIVGGPLGHPQLAIVHGGEEVVDRGEQRSGGGSVIVKADSHTTVAGDLGPLLEIIDDRIEAHLEDQNEHEGRRGKQG